MRNEPSVIAVNEAADEEAATKHPGFLRFGVKDTEKFPHHVFDLLRNDPDCLWHTVDRMANKGRSIDTALTNPLTYRAMTGSTSGGAVNILLGINDFALGTDGGGSVLAPALSCQLPSFIAAGFSNSGLFATGTSVSTDGIEIRPSVGVIGKSVEMLVQILSKIFPQKIQETQEIPENLKIAIPQKNSLFLPTGEDMNAKIVPFAEKIEKFSFSPFDMSGADDRARGIDICKKCFENGFDLILTYEGPIDVLGYGETIPAQFGGVGASLARGGGKFLLKAANPAGCSAATVPSSELASGFVIIARHGRENAMFALARELEQLVVLPEVFVRYFLTEERRQGGFETRV